MINFISCIKNGVAIIVCLLLIYPIYFNAIPKIISQAAYHILPMMYLVYARESCYIIIREIIKDRCIKNIAVAFYVCFVFALVKLLFQNEESSYFLVFINMISGMLKYFAIYIFILRNVKDGVPLAIFLKSYVTIVCIYVISSVVMLIDINLRMFWQSLLLINENSLVDVVNDGGMYVSRFGLQGWSGFTNTLSCSLAMMMLTIGLKNKLISTRWMYIVPLLLLGNLFYGRIGVIASVCIFIFYIISGLSLKKIKFLGIFLCGLLGIIISKDFIVDIYPYLNNWLNWLSGPLNAFVEGLQSGKLDFGSSGNATIKDMYFIPDQDLTIILGDGRYQNYDGSYYGHTDAGFMRNLLYWGICGELMFYIPLLMIVYELIKVNLKYEAIVIFFLFFIFEIKGDAYQFCYGLCIVMYYMLIKYCIGERDKCV